MKNEQPTTSSTTVVPSDVVALPIAIYELNGLIYQLYQGGQPYQPWLIHWQRLKTVTITREGNSAVDVHVNQGRTEPQTERQ